MATFTMNLHNFLNGHPIFEHNKQITEICKPLFKTGLNYFSHARVNNNNALTCLSTSADFCDKYFKNKYYEFDLHKKSFQNGEHYIVWDFVERLNQTRNLHTDFMSFDMGHTFSIVVTRNRIRDCYHFAAPLGDISKNQFYLDNIHHLKKFIYYFLDEVSRDPRLAKSYQRKLMLSDDQGGFLIENQEAPIITPPLKRIAVNGNEAYLSMREYDCLHWLSHGKTIDEVSTILNITPRTVKAHVTNMKDKLGCVSLFQLGMVYRDLEHTLVVAEKMGDRGRKG